MAIRSPIASRMALIGLLGSSIACDPPPPLEREPADQPLARLTAEQYRNSVRDLFPHATLPRLEFPAPLEAAGGFENNATFNAPTGPWIEAQARAAGAVASAIDIDALGLDCQFEHKYCAHGYLLLLIERAWRRPLHALERHNLLSDFDRWQATYGSLVALRLTIQVLLQSPDFLYLPRFGAPGEPLSSWEMAARLSYLLWNSVPDEQLLALARRDGLRERELVIAQSRRMLADPRAREAVVSLHRQLFDLDASSPLDTEYFAERLGDVDMNFYHLRYLPQVRYEGEVFVMQQVFEGPGTLAALLTSNHAWVTPDTARIAYEIEIPHDAPSLDYATPSLLSHEQQEHTYYAVTLDPERRAGLFTLAGFLSAHSNPRDPSPVRRGVTLIERLQCRELTLPGDVPPLVVSEDEDEPLTNRERYAQHSSVAECRSCHATIDGIGFTFENYDALGSWRDLDNGHPVDASGELLGTDVDGPVDGAVELMHRLAHSRTIHDCYVRQVFRWAFGRNETAADAPALAALADGFWASGGDILELLVEIAASDGFRHVSP